MVTRIRAALAYSDFLTVPMAIADVLVYRPPASTVASGGIAAGALAWTFIEYWVHRGLHSKRFLDFHMRHHQHPTDASGGTLYSSAVILTLVLIAVGVPAMAPAIAGVLLGYLWFIVLHHAEHHGVRLRGSVLTRLAANHDLHHHAGPARMFGVTTALWDHVFRTA